jgi:hypothetical protein
VRRAQVHDDLADEAETQELNAQREQQDGEQEQRPVGDPLALEAAHQQHQ